jgi:hypothetical protein
MTTTVDVYRGDDVPITVTISENVDGVATPLDLVGAVLTSTVGGTPGWTGTPVVIDAASGVCEIQIPAATMATIAPGCYPIDVQVVKDGKKRTATIFNLHVVADVTLT